MTATPTRLVRARLVWLGAALVGAHALVAYAVTGATAALLVAVGALVVLYVADLWATRW